MLIVESANYGSLTLRRRQPARTRRTLPVNRVLRIARKETRRRISSSSGRAPPATTTILIRREQLDPVGDSFAELQTASGRPVIRIRSFFPWVDYFKLAIVYYTVTRQLLNVCDNNRHCLKIYVILFTLSHGVSDVSSLMRHLL